MKRKEVYFLLSTSSLCLLSFVSSLQDIVFLLGKTRPFSQTPLGQTYLTLQNIFNTAELTLLITVAGRIIYFLLCVLSTGTKSIWVSSGALGGGWEDQGDGECSEVPTASRAALPFKFWW